MAKELLGWPEHVHLLGSLVFLGSCGGGLLRCPGCGGLLAPLDGRRPPVAAHALLGRLAAFFCRRPAGRLRLENAACCYSTCSCNATDCLLYRGAAVPAAQHASGAKPSTVAVITLDCS